MGNLCVLCVLCVLCGENMFPVWRVSMRTVYIDPLIDLRLHRSEPPVDTEHLTGYPPPIAG